MKSRIVFMAIIPIFLAATIARGEPQGTPIPNLVAQLEPMTDICDWRVRTLTGGPKGVMLLHNAKMRRILDELKAGQPVGPKEIDEIMKEHSWRDNYYSGG